MSAISKICRLCLNNARRTYSVNDTILQNVWERLTNLKFDNHGGGPFHVCFICCAQLRRCQDLMERAVKAEQLFTKYIINNQFEDSKKLVSLIVSKAYEIDYNYAIEHRYNFEFKHGGTDAMEEVNEINISIKEEVKDELTEFGDEHFTAAEEVNTEDEESCIKENKDSSHAESFEIKNHSESNTTFGNMALEKMFAREAQIVLRRIDKDDFTRNHKIMLALNNKKLPSKVVSENGMFKQSVPECTSALPSMPIRSSQGNILYTRSIKGLKKPLLCDICQYRCPSISKLNTHLRKHTGEKPFQCNLCDFKCSQNSYLKRHIQSKHTKQKNFSCDFCDMKFITKEHLNRHLRRHTGIKPYICDICDSRYSDKRGLKHHIEGRHLNIKYSCNICEKKFVEINCLRNHLLKCFRKLAHTREKP